MRSSCRKTLIVLGLGLSALLLWKLADVLLLAFGAVLVAILLHAASELSSAFFACRNAGA